MVTNIRLLEQRIHDAVERLRDLTAERDRLAGEVRDLKTRLSESGTGAARETVGPTAEPVGDDERLRIAAELRGALDELRDRPATAGPRGHDP